MGRLCLLAVFLLLQQAESLIWEFGDDAKEMINISHLSGHIKPMENIKQVDIPLQPCLHARYLLVEVINDHSSPIVTYDPYLSVVTISFMLSQQAESRYDILVKGKKIRNCHGGDENEKSGSQLFLSKKKHSKPYNSNYRENIAGGDSKFWWYL